MFVFERECQYVNQDINNESGNWLYCLIVMNITKITAIRTKCISYHE